MINDLNLKDFHVSEMKSEEMNSIHGGSGASYSVGWLIGAALAMPVIFVASAIMAVNLEMNSGYSGFDRSA